MAYEDESTASEATIKSFPPIESVSASNPSPARDAEDGGKNG